MAPVIEDTIGYWGPPTSTLDWCETNYEVSTYNYTRVQKFNYSLLNKPPLKSKLWEGQGQTHLLVS